LSRIATSLVIVAGVMVLGPAFGQPVQYQFTPPPPVQPLPFHPFESPSTLQIPGVVPPDRVVPDRAGKRSARLHRTAPTSPETYVTRHGRVVVVPPAVSGQELYSDRMARCAQAGAGAGVGANHLGAFTTRCAQ
jgi:hypothetical protein